MRSKKAKSIPTNSKLNLGCNAKPKTKSPGRPTNNIIKKRNKISSKPQSPNKLSTLDIWLRSLYQSHSQTNKNVSTMATVPDTAKIPDQHLVERSAKLVIRLEKLDLSQLKNSKTSQKDQKYFLEDTEGKGQTKKRKPDAFIYKDRSSEYTRLSNKKYKCVKCDFVHSNLISMRSHFDKKHNEQFYECKLCPFKTTQQYYFNSHVRYHSRPDMECPHCKKMIKWFSYKMHIKTHERNDKTEYKCEFCEYRSYNHANVKRHALTLHKNPNELQMIHCDMCNYVTILEERLKQHKKVVHSKEGLWLTCPDCEYTTRNKSHLARHINDVHREKTIQCDQCSMIFSSKDHLRYHKQRKHTDASVKKFYYCEMCPKEEQYRTTEKGNLARHILAHRTLDEIEVFACHKCPYLGKCKNALKTHLINAHLPEMHNFKCKVCGYSTSTKSRYKLHVRDVHGEPSSEKNKRLKKNNNTIEISLNNGEVAAADFGRNEETDLGLKEEVDDLLETAEDLDVSVITNKLTLVDFWRQQNSLCSSQESDNFL